MYFCFINNHINNMIINNNMSILKLSKIEIDMLVMMFESGIKEIFCEVYLKIFDNHLIIYQNDEGALYTKIKLENDHSFSLNVKVKSAHLFTLLCKIRKDNLQVISLVIENNKITYNSGSIPINVLEHLGDI